MSVAAIGADVSMNFCSRYIITAVDRLQSPLFSVAAQTRRRIEPGLRVHEKRLVFFRKRNIFRIFAFPCGAGPAANVYEFMSLLHVYGLPELVDPRELQGSTAIVIDVLRATTTTVSALHAGATRVVPLLEVEEALNLKRKILEGNDPRFTPELSETDLLLGGERQGKRIEGFDLGNSPREHTPERVAGKTILFSTTNGTKAMYRTLLAETILPACFLNAEAVVRSVSGSDSIHLICAGTEGKFTEEDLYLAGLLVERIQKAANQRFRLNAQAVAVLETWERLFDRKPVDPRTLAKHLYESRGGRNLCRIGLKPDIDIVAQIDSIPLVVRLDPKKMIIESENS